MAQESEFDAYSGTYDQALARGISVSGEDKDYFAEGRVLWLSKSLSKLGFKLKSVLDFGCGTGSATPFLVHTLQVKYLLGTDTSEKSIEIARQLYGSETATFKLSNDFRPLGNVDLAFCNGVFHHIPPAERSAAIVTILQALRPGGLFAFWENNPWNPGTRYVMSRIPFDRDAITLSSMEAGRLLRSNGFDIISLDYLFIFPRPLGWLRWLEPILSKVPIGAQYMVLARKPTA